MPVVRGAKVPWAMATAAAAAAGLIGESKASKEAGCCLRLVAARTGRVVATWSGTAVGGVRVKLSVESEGS